MSSEMSAAVFSMWNVWNGSGCIMKAWPVFAAQVNALTQYNSEWIRQLSAIGDLTSNLVKFSKKDQI